MWLHKNVPAIVSVSKNYVNECILLEDGNKHIQTFRWLLRLVLVICQITRMQYSALVEVIVRAGANRFSLWRPLCFAAICWNDVISTARLKPIKELHRCYIGSIERVILHPFGLNTPHLKNSFFPCMKHEGISRLCHANGSDWGFTPHDPCFAVWIGLLDHWLQDLDVCVGKMMRIFADFIFKNMAHQCSIC